MSREPLHIEFPADADYIPALRKFIAESAMIEGFSQKFGYRTEIIVDELCNNAVKYGSSSPNGRVKIFCEFDTDVMQLTIQDAGGQEHDLQNLRRAIAEPQGERRFMGHGLEIVRMLTSDMELTQTPGGETVIRVVKRRSQNLIDTMVE